MKTDSFKLQLQGVLTAFYEDIKGIQGASGWPKTKIVKHQIEDQEEAGSSQEQRPRTRPALTTLAPPPPRWPQALQVLLSPPVGRSLQLCLHLLSLPPAQP
jgi:hypothetical protein